MIVYLESFVEQGELYYVYLVQWPDAIRTRYQENPNLAGISLIGTITDRVGNTVAIRLEIDQDDALRIEGKKDFYFAYALESKAYYCMPVVGAKTHLYFPTGKEWEAIAVHSLRSTTPGAKQEKKTKNPEEKFWSHENGVSIALTPQEIHITPQNEDTVNVVLKQDGTIMIQAKRWELFGKTVKFGKTVTEILPDGI